MQIGPYEIEGTLGEGGMGVVYRARSRVTGESAAVKTVRLPRLSSLAGIRREIQRLGRLRHPGVVRVFEHGVHEGLPWYAMELLEGSTWSQHFRRQTFTNEGPTMHVGSSTRDGWGRGAVGHSDDVVGKPIAPDEISELCRIARRLCDALSYIHGEGVVHRDLKPANVLLRADALPTLVDFGLVVEHSGSGGREVLDVEAIHAGTAAYMAPEQIAGELVDARADVFALGCMIYESLTGRLPFPKHLEGRRRELGEVVRAPSRFAPAVPAALDALVMSMLERDPRERIGHASDVAAVLDRQLGVSTLNIGEPRAYVYRSRFAGRDLALDALTAKVAALEEGQGGRVLVEGESGSGKTRLILEVVRRAKSEQLNMVACECSPLDATSADHPVPHPAPLAPLQPLLRAVADRCRTGGADATARLLGARLAVLKSIEPTLAHLPGAERWPEPAPLPPEAAKHRVLSAMADTLKALADDAPVLLLVDDLHWADNLTLDLVSYLDPARVNGARLLFIGTSRKEERVPALESLAQAPDVMRLVLDRLDDATVGVLVGDILAVKQAPPELVRFIADRAEGNPFYVNEYLRTAVSEGVLRRNAQAEWVLAGQTAAGGDWTARLEALALPRTLREIVARRLAGLDAELSEIVATAAVLGREFDAELLQRLCPLDEARFADAMNELLRRNLFVPSTGGRYRFAHDKLREGAADTIAPARLRAMHLAIAEAYEARCIGPDELTRLAHHWGHALDEDKERFYLELAGEQALNAGAHQEAEPLFARAILLADAHAPPLAADGPARLHQRHTDALWGLGDTHRGALEAETTLSLMGVRVATSPARVALSLTRQLVEQLWRVSFHGGRAAPPSDEPLAVARAEAALRLSQCYLASQRTQSQVMYSTLLAANLADRAGQRGPKAIPYAVLGAAAGMMRLEGLAQQYFERGRADANRRADPASYAAAGIMEASHYYAAAKWTAFDERTAEDLAIAAAVGDRPAWEGLMLVASGADLLRGRLTEGAARLEQVRGSAGARAGHFMNAWATTLLAVCRLWEGRTGAALELGLAARRDFRADGGVAVANPVAVRVAALAASGDHAQALREADEALALLKKGPILYFMWPACDALTTGLTELWHAAMVAGVDVAPARTRALTAGRLARTLASRSAIGRPIALRAAAAVARLEGRTSRALALLDTADAAASALAMPIAAAQIHRERERLSSPTAHPNERAPQ